MLALAQFHGWDTARYVEAGHPVQRRMLDEVARWTGSDAEGIETGVDGCGVVCFALPLTHMARSYARFADRAAAGDPCARIVDAMVRNPFEVAGTGRLCTRLMEVAEGRIFAKVGAEGMYCAGSVEHRMGLTVKSEDGARRACEVALLAAMRDLGWLSEAQLAELVLFANPDCRNTLGDVVGRIEPRLRLKRGG
jgi:L-asparaginase II